MLLPATDIPLTWESSVNYCREISHHYENFSVVSRLTPGNLRTYILIVYAFARVSDDLVDEEKDRAQFLQWRRAVETLSENSPQHPVLYALKHLLERTGLSLSPFLDLLHAFEQDLDVNRYQTFDELLEYCRYSANPVGRIYLHLLGESDPTLLTDADRVCTGLQLTNFLQDVYSDVHNEHIYLPLEWLQDAGVVESDLLLEQWPSALTGPLNQLEQQARRFLRAGDALVQKLPRRSGYPLKLFYRGGLRALDLWQRSADKQSPRRLRRPDYLRIGFKSLLF